jgi:AcrR family transcriptional regulator
VSPTTTTKEAVVEEFRIRSIQEAAIKVIGRKGVAGASMQDIAEEAGISKGTIYLYFENQQQLLRRAAEYIFSQLKDRVIAAFDSPGRFEDRLRAALRIQFEYFQQNKDFLRAYGAMAADEEKCARLTKPIYQAYVQRFSKFLVEAMRKGEIRTVDGQRLALFLTEGIGAVLFLRTDEKSPPDVDEEVDWLTSIIVEGIKKGSRK